MSFSVVPLLIGEDWLSAKARQALIENRLKDAAELFMKEYGLSRAEASDLLGISACQDGCGRCLSGEDATYRVYSDVMDMAVCAACADEARKLGIGVEPFSQE